MFLIVSSSLALAVTINTDKTDYNRPDIVNVDITGCTGISILRVSNANLPVPDLVFIDDSNGDWSTTYNTASDSSDGKYTLFVSCADGTDTKNFCVNAAGCLGVSPADDGSEEGGLPAANGSGEDTGGTTSPGGGGGSGGSGCQSDWSCSSWSYCNKDLKQTRVCTDENNCRTDKTESRDCSKCQESWVCLQWSACQNGVNLRNCFDDHMCGTVLLKPALEKSCQAANAPGPAPARISTQLSSSASDTSIQKVFSIGNLWEDYKIYFISALSGLILLILAIILVSHFTSKPKEHAANFQELKDWITEERKLGTSDEQIKGTLKRDTSWKDPEINDAFKELDSPDQTKKNNF